MSDTPYTREQLYSNAPQPSYPDDAREAAFVLGGIGTGNVSLGARGELRDWEIFNRPGKGNALPYSFFAIWARAQGQPAVTKVLEAKIPPPYSKSHGFHSNELAGLPRLASSQMRGEYPFVKIQFCDPDLPVQVDLEAFTPFIPLNAKDSAIPAALLRYTVRNTTPVPVEVTLAGSLANVAGFEAYNPDPWRGIRLADNGQNEFKNEEGLQGLYYSCAELAPDNLNYGSMTLATTHDRVTHKLRWLAGAWWDGAHDFWDDLSEDGQLTPLSRYRAKNVSETPGIKIGSLGLMASLAPGEAKQLEFILAWHRPNRPRGWEHPTGEGSSCGCAQGQECCATVRNHYALHFENAWSAARYLAQNLERLEKLSRDFHRALFSSTFPPYVLDALASNITVLRSTTCFRLEDGTFLGWEGCHDSEGCCDGSCTHVWNYAQTLAFLFPELEQSMRRVEFNTETDDDGKMTFRARQVFGLPKWDFHPAADGQLGTIIRLYRDWKLSGNDQLLREVWPNAVKALEFAFSYWDSDGDCVLDSQQHNTYDIEFYGPNSLTNSMFYGALKAAAQMADYLGDQPRAERYRQTLAKGSAAMDQMLWEKDYYVQRIEDVDEYRYQYGLGCLSDQLFGQMLAHVAGLGYVLPQEHVRQAMLSVYRYNFRRSFAAHESVQRTYALNDEKGLVLCSWPKGGRPRLPFVYSDEVWTGIEYQVAAHLVYEGHVEEGLTVVKAVRERHDGYRRNPWNEVECGHHYARSMASWALLTALSGFGFDMVRGKVSFAPRLNQENFSTFWSTATAWGIYRQRRRGDGQTERQLEVLYGEPNSVCLEEAQEQNASPKEVML